MASQPAFGTPGGIGYINPQQQANAANPTPSQLQLPGGSFYDSNDPFQGTYYMKSATSPTAYNQISLNALGKQQYQQKLSAAGFQQGQSIAWNDPKLEQARAAGASMININGNYQIIEPHTADQVTLGKQYLQSQGIDLSNIPGQNFADRGSADVTQVNDINQLKGLFAAPAAAAPNVMINNTGPNPLATPAQLAASKAAETQQLASLQGMNLQTQTDANGNIISSQTVPLANGAQAGGGQAGQQYNYVNGQAVPVGQGNQGGQTSQTSPTPQSTPTSAATLPDQADRTALAKVVDDYNKKSQEVQNAIANINSGATPLTSGESAQITGLQQQMQTLIDNQTRANTTAQNSATMRGYQTGSAEYDNLFAITTIGKIASAGQQEVQKLQVQEAAAVAQLTESFHQKDIQAVKDAWNMYQDAYTETRNQIQKTIDATTQAIEKANNDYYTRVTKPISDLESEAAKNGAPASVLNAIKNSQDVTSAINASGGYLQTATGDLGDYLAYQRQAKATGQVASSYDDWLKAKKAADSAQKASEAYSTAYGTAKGKAAGEAAGGVGALKPLTGEQTNNFTYAQMSSQANDIIAAKQGNILSMNPQLFAAAMATGNNGFAVPFMSTEMRDFLQARYNFASAVLRKQSGAAISAGEYATADMVYMPRPGDSTEALAQKAQARQTFIDTTKQAVPNYDLRITQTPAGLLNNAENVATETVTQYAAKNPQVAASVRSMVAAGKSYADIKTLLGI